VLNTRKKSKIQYEQERRKSTWESGLISRSSIFVKGKDGTNGNGDTVSPFYNAPILSEIVGLRIINNVMVVVIATGAHKALVSRVQLLSTLQPRSLRQSQIYQGSMTIL
jgi:hypothetical protein